MAEYIVTLNNDEADGDVSAADLSLREAIQLAENNPGVDTITFDSSVFTGGEDSVIRLTLGELYFTEGLIIDGSTVTDLVISGDANGDDVLVGDSFVTDVAASLSATGDADRLDDNSRVLNFDKVFPNSGTVTLKELTITGGRTTEDGWEAGGGGIRFQNSGDLVLNDVQISGNSTSGRNAEGGGISIEVGGVTMTNSVISGNTTSGDGAKGGGIFSIYGDNTITNSTISGNATSGGKRRWRRVLHQLHLQRRNRDEQHHQRQRRQRREQRRRRDIRERTSWRGADQLDCSRQCQPTNRG